MKLVSIKRVRTNTNDRNKAANQIDKTFCDY